MRKSYVIAAVIAVASVVWIGSGQISGKEVPAGGVKEAPVTAKSELPSVRVRRITATQMFDNAIVNGRSEASRTAVLSAKITGQVAEIMVEKGRAVEKGAVIVRIETDDREAVVRQAKALVKQREIEYSGAEKLAAKGYDSEMKVAGAKAALEAARAALEAAEIALDDTNIRAPFDGVFENRHVQVGDFLDKGTAVATVVDLDPIKMVAYVSESQVGRLSLGSEAKANLIDGREVTGTISYIASTAGEQTRTFRVEVDVPNPDNGIVEGMTVKLFLPMGRHLAHRISPAILGLADDGTVGVKLVDENNIVHFVPVQIVGDEADAMWITGLPDEATVITVGHAYVTEGQKVAPTESEAEGLL